MQEAWGAYDRGVTDIPDPISRRDRQKQTREAIIFAARAAFSELGYHGARLDEIARAAGFSKGAVYSNFANKAELFLAVMDRNTEESLASRELDLFSRESVDMSAEDEATRMVKGFALATLEFIAVAARDEGLAAKVAARFDMLSAAYESVVVAARRRRAGAAGEADDSTGGGAVDGGVDGAEGGGLADGQVGMLLAGFDQGMGWLSLVGGRTVDSRVRRAGLLRLSGLSESDLQYVTGGEGLQSRVIRDRLLEMGRGRDGAAEAGG